MLEGRSSPGPIDLQIDGWTRGVRHAQACPRHPRLRVERGPGGAAWMAGTSPAMTGEEGAMRGGECGSGPASWPEGSWPALGSGAPRSGPRAPEHVIPEHLLPEHLLPEHLLPGHLLPGHLLPRHLLPRQLPPEPLLPEQSAPGRCRPDIFLSDTRLGCPSLSGPCRRARRGAGSRPARAAADWRGRTPR